MLSIIIPTYNEERFLPELLDSIKKQNIKGYEVIVSDNGSKDDTIAIAKRFRCKIVRGGLPGRARNTGAALAAHENLIFLDSDIVMPKDFLKLFLKKIKKKDLDYASCIIKPMTHNMDHLFYYMLKNLGNRIFPFHTNGQCLYMKKNLFQKIGGYDENLAFGEEHDLVRRAAKQGKGKIFSDIYVFGNTRRIAKEGTYRTLAKDISSELFRFVSPIRKPIYNKEYGHY